MLPTSSRVGRIGLTAALAVFPMLAGAQESPDLVGMWSGKVEAGVRVRTSSTALTSLMRSCGLLPDPAGRPRPLGM